MKIVVLILAIIIGLILGKTKIGYFISTVLFVAYWRFLVSEGYVISHMSTIYVGQESGFNGPVADWFAIISSSLLFAGVCTYIPDLLGFIIGKSSFLTSIFDKVLSLFEPSWNKFEDKDKGISYVKKLDKQNKLEVIAENALVPEVAIEAAKKVNNKSVLFNIAKIWYKDINLRKTCVDLIDDKSMLERLSKTLTRKDDQLKDYVKDKIKEFEK